MKEPFVIAPDWVRTCAEAIATRHGVLLKNCLTSAEEGEAMQLESDAPEVIAALVQAALDDVLGTTREYRQRHPITTAATARAGSGRGTAATTDVSADEQELLHCVETAVRVGVTGALVRYQRLHRKIVVAADLDKAAGAVPHARSAAGEDGELRLQQSLHSTLLNGLLFAFEALQQAHSMRREHYPPRLGNKTMGTVGWDTIVLLHFVHHIPQVARLASATVVNEAAGTIVRSWRKLLVALQSLDTEEQPEHSRRRGALAIINGLLIFLFQCHNTHQCHALLSMVEHAEQIAQTSKDPAKSLVQPSQHMTSEVVTFEYYRGRMWLYARRLTEALDALRRAYTLLPPPGHGTDAQYRNKQRVRFFLAVTGIASGRRLPLPIVEADELLPLVFDPLVTAIERGDPVSLHLALEHFGSTLRRRGVFFVLLQAKLLCYLMLMARVHAAMGKIKDVDNSRVTLKTLVAAHRYVLEEGRQLRAAEQNMETSADPAHVSSSAKAKRRRELAEEEEALEDMNEDRMVLWVAKLIAHSYVKGYISYEHKTVVLSRIDPFPSLRADAPPLLI